MPGLTEPDRTHLLLIPSYNTGPAMLLRTVAEARAAWAPVWVVLDGSTDGSAEALRAHAPDVRVLSLPRNRGKGAAVRHGLREAMPHGFTHALVMDADGQHPADRIAAFMAASRAQPGAVIMGVPVFGPDAPALRVRGRVISNWWAKLETPWSGMDDSLFGFRVYPIAPLLAVMARSPGMARFDFDPEAAVRLAWRGLELVNRPARVRYPKAEAGGVSHFRYGRDNVLLTAMHVRLVFGALARLPLLLWRRTRR